MIKIVEEFPDYYVNTSGEFFNKNRQKLKPQISHKGYRVLKFYQNGNYFYRRCCRLVGLAFLKDQYKQGLVINHKDLDKTNDCVSNLEWVTSSCNFRHSFDNQPEEHKGNRQYSEEIIHNICNLLEQGFQRKFIMEYLEVPEHLVKRVKNRVYWTWISDNYSFQTIGRGVSVTTVKWVKFKILEGWSNEKIMTYKKVSLLTEDFLDKVRKGIYWDFI